jgi:nucleotide-binding universal stress UspA family protein
VTAGGAPYVRGRAIKDLLAAYDAETAHLESERRAHFEAVAAREGLSAEWRPIRSPLTESVVAHARYADVAVVARSDPGGREPPVIVPEWLVFGSGRPVILLPARAPATLVRRVVVGWNASREATRAVADALPLLAHAEAVEVLVVDPERHAGHGQEPGADIARHLARHGLSVEVRLLDSGGEPVSSTLLARAAAFGAELLIVGAYGHSRLTELVFGGTTRRVLREAELPVLMSR